jgi:hypothetical protein
MLVWLRLIPFDANKNDGDDYGSGLNPLPIDFQRVTREYLSDSEREDRRSHTRGLKYLYQTPLIDH